MKSHATRTLAARDLDAVVAIDAALGSGRRRAYFERRLATAQQDPERHLQFAVDDEGALAGFMLGRTLEGEFGRSEPELRLEAFGVKTSAQSHVLDCSLANVELGSTGENPLATGQGPADPNDYGTPGPGDAESLARDGIEVGLLNEGDLEGVARVDRRHTGRDRRGYLCRTVREALADSAIRISLAARMDGGVAGYLMARVDYGDFGRAEPAAVIDTVGVDPLRPRQGIGRALLSQLFVNLRGLQVERVETVVAADKFDLLGFFYAAGMRPAERLAFVKKL